MADSVGKQLDKHLQTNLQATDSQGLYTNPQTKGVTIPWLAEAFDMPEATVRHRMRNCPVKTTRKRGTHMQVKLYDLRVAAGYLVAPRFTTKEYMARLKKNELPAQLQQAVWDALLKRQKWEENAGQLWRTDRIREVLGSTFQSMKFQMQLFIETMERQVEVTDAQREILRDSIDGLQRELYEKLVQNMQDKNTPSQLSYLEEAFGETDTVADLTRNYEPTFEDDFEDVKDLDQMMDDLI